MTIKCWSFCLEQASNHLATPYSNNHPEQRSNCIEMTWKHLNTLETM